MEVTADPKSINSTRRLAGYFKGFKSQIWWSARLKEVNVKLPPKSLDFSGGLKMFLSFVEHGRRQILYLHCNRA